MAKGNYRSFSNARRYVRKLKLSSYQEWLRYCAGKMRSLPKRPRDIPVSVRSVYLNKGWKGYADWLGTGNISYRHHRWRPFSKARAFVHKLKLSSNREWRAYVRGDLRGKPPLPRDIPTNPNYVYAKREWKGYGDWLGTGNEWSRARRRRRKRKAK